MSKQYAVLVAIVLFGGCSGSSLPTAADPSRSRDSLKVALDAWQNGATTESLRSSTPAIHVNDPLWAGGKKLVKYEIKSEQPAGQSWRCEVLLTVKSNDGPTSQNHATYCIDTDPAVVIVREP